MTQLRFLGFNYAFGSNLLTISPEPTDPIQAGDGISVSGQTITNTHKMCNVVVYSGITETIIPGDQITALQMPYEFDFFWFESSGVLQLISNSASSPDIIVGSTTYNSYDKVRHHGSTATLTNESGNEVLNLYPTHTDQPPNYTINGSTYQAGAIQEVVFNNFQASIASQTLFWTPPSVGVFQIPDGASTQGALTVTGNLTCNSAVNSVGALTCDSLTVTQGLPGGGGFSDTTNALSLIHI